MKEKKQKILIVDDDHYNLIVLTDILKSDYRTIVAKNGEDALRRADSPTPPDLVLLDIMMPEMDGYEVCRRLKKNQKTRDIPVIFITAMTQAEDEVRGFDLGAVDYINKPVNAAVVRTRVETHLALSIAHRKLEEQNTALREANKKIMDSIRYARLIQKSVLSPNLDRMKACFPNSFVIWIPKDVVSGDIIFFDTFQEGVVIAVVDCTGHGVPGALMTMIASSGLTKMIKEEGCRNPAEILKKLNTFVKTTLYQDTEYALSNDGLDAAICFITHQTPDNKQQTTDNGQQTTDNRKLIFAGARLPLFHISDGNVHVIKGDRQSIGYKRSDLCFDFTNHTIPVEKEMFFYMLTDGFLDQLNEEGKRRLGSKAFINLLDQNAEKSFEAQKEGLLQAFNDHKGSNERQDDVTVVGFEC